STWRDLTVKLECNQQSPAPHLFDDVELVPQIAQSLHEIATDHPGVANQVLRFDLSLHSQADGACERVSAESRVMLARLEHAERRFGQRRADREPARQPFGKRHDVRLDAPKLMAPQGPGAPDSCLHLVKDQRQMSLIA